MGAAASGHVKAEKKPSKSDEFKVLVELGIVSSFSLVALLTRHGHWLKDAPEVKPITMPILRYIDTLPKADLERLRRWMGPSLLLLGIGSVVGPDLKLEIEIRRYEAARRLQEAQGQYAQGPRVGQADANPRSGRGAVPRGNTSNANPNGASDVNVAPDEDLLGVVIGE